MTTMIKALFGIRRKPGTRKNGSFFDEVTIQKVWEKGIPVFGKDLQVWRKDNCGTLIKRDQHNKSDSSFGWEIDHIIPVTIGGDDQLFNLQPLHWENNRQKGNEWIGWKPKKIVLNGHITTSNAV